MIRFHLHLLALVILSVIVTPEAIAVTNPYDIQINLDTPSSSQEVIATIQGCTILGLTIQVERIIEDDLSQPFIVLAITDYKNLWPSNLIYTTAASCSEVGRLQIPLGKLRPGNYEVLHKRPISFGRLSETMGSGHFTVIESDMQPTDSVNGNTSNLEFSLELNPEFPKDDEDVLVTINSCGLLNYAIDFNENKSIQIKEDKTEIARRNDPRSVFCSVKDTTKLKLGQLNPGGYLISHTFIQDQQGIFSSGVYIGQTYTVWNSETGLPIQSAHHESPAQDSIQTGIGLIRGWACNASKVEISIDGERREEVPYGGSRGDTKAVCGNDGFNGYGTVMAWGLLSAGEHRMQTFVDGIKISDVTFKIVKLDDGFLNREGVKYTLPDFPNPGQQIMIQWSDAKQNFTVVNSSEFMQ